MLEGIEESIEDWEEPPIFWQGEQGTLLRLGSNSSIGGRDEPIETKPKPLDSEGEEEDEEEEGMDDPNLEWVTQGPLALSVILHKMSKWLERMNIKFNPDNMVKAEDHLKKFYLQL